MIQVPVTMGLKALRSPDLQTSWSCHLLLFSRYAAEKTLRDRLCLHIPRKFYGWKARVQQGKSCVLFSLFPGCGGNPAPVSVETQLLRSLLPRGGAGGRFPSPGLQRLWGWERSQSPLNLSLPLLPSPPLPSCPFASRTVSWGPHSCTDFGVDGPPGVRPASSPAWPPPTPPPPGPTPRRR